MFSLLCVCVCVSFCMFRGFVCMCRVFVCVFFCMCFCLSHFVGLCFWCIVRFSSFDCVLFFVCFHFVSVCCFVFSSLYRSLNILFVLLITGCFCLRSRIFIRLNKSAFFLLCFVSDSCLRLPCCGWCLFLWPSADTLLRSLLVVSFCCVCGVGVVYSFSLI